MKNKIQDYVYEPVGYFVNPNHKNDKSRCEARVSDHDTRMASYYQCKNKPVEFIQGIGFCKLHAPKVKRGLGLLVESTTRFAAELKYGEPSIAKLSIASETKNRFDVLSSENILGSMHIFSGPQNKEDRFSHGREYFDDYDSALSWLLEQSEEQVASAKEHLEKAVKQAENIRSMTKA